MLIVRTLSLWLLLTCAAGGQVLLAAPEARKLTPFFDEAPNSLKCFHELKKPALDFGLRFIAHYRVECKFPSRETLPGGLLTYIRVTPEARGPVFLGSAWKIAGKQEEATVSERQSHNLELKMGGAFALGRGRYLVDLLVTDDQGRTSRKRWKVAAGIGSKYSKMIVNIQPLAVEPAMPKWDVAGPYHGGLRVTVMLHALGSHQNSVLRAPDRDFLLQLLYSLARQIPYRALRVVAFSLGQQQEIFREDNFSEAAFRRLSDSLDSVDTATVSVNALRTIGSPRLAVELANREATESNPPDAVIFVGEVAYLDMLIFPGAITRIRPDKPLFVSFVYDPSNTNLTDVLQRLSKSVNGKTFRFHSPIELERDIKKLVVQLDSMRGGSPPADAE